MSPRSSARRAVWPAIAMLAAFAPLARGLSLTNIFYVRDLTLFFWPRHLWLREALRQGRLPLWDPYSSAGQPTFPDALNQLFLPPVALLRALLPAGLGFNLIVSLPLPLAALGAWLFLRRHVSAASATIGSIAFAASGVVLSSADFPNLSWSVAWMPWMLWALEADCDAPTRRTWAAFAAFTALQMLSGEPVTMAGTLIVAGAYALARFDRPAPLAARVRVSARLGAAVALAAAVSAVQLVPMVLAAQHSPRTSIDDVNFWSLHPLWTIETVMPHVFGDTFTNYNPALPWIPPLNSTREPFFFSIYLGPVVLLLALLGSLAGPRRWRVFWLSVAGVGLLFGLGEYTPVYPALQRVVPALSSFRFPAKFFLFASFAVAMLVASGAEALISRDPETGEPVAPPWTVRATLAAGLAGGLLLAVLIAVVAFAPFLAARAFFLLGRAVEVADPVEGAQFLFRSVPPVAARTLVLLVASGLLAWLGWSRRREAGVARLALFALVVGDLLAVHAGLNPVLPAASFAAPSWTAALRDHPSDRFYFGGKFSGAVVETDEDVAFARYAAPAGLSVIEGRSVLSAYVALTPTPWHVREMLSYDLPLLWPIEHYWVMLNFEHADRPFRERFLQRVGVRYCLTATPVHADDRLVAVFTEPFATVPVYECFPHASRVHVVPGATVVADHKTGVVRLFQDVFDASHEVMLESTPPPASGTPGSAGKPWARIVEDAAEEVVVEAAAGSEGGYLVLLDSYDPGWRVEVDGAPAPLLRANVLFRAVRLAPGPHHVRFTYRPSVLYTWLTISSLSALVLAGAFLKRRPSRSARGADNARGRR